MGGRLEEGRPMERFGLRDDQWDRIKDILPGREGHVGGTAPDNRLFVEALLYRFRTGIPGRNWPARFGYGRACISVSADGRRAGFLSGFSGCWRATPITN